MPEAEKKPAYMKMTVDTPLFIDFDYWKSKEQKLAHFIGGVSL